MKTVKILIALAVVVTGFAGCTSKQEKMKKELTDFIRRHDSVMIPLYKQTTLAAWDAAISGKPEDFKKSEELNLKMMALYSNKESLKKLEEIKVSGMITDSLLNRQLDVLYRSFLMAKADTAKLNAMVRMGTAIEQKYGNFRAEVKGKKMSDNEVEEVLRSSKDVKYQREVWEAQKKIGTVVAADVIALVKLRNEVAKDLGFKNYHEMSLTLSDQDPKEVSKLFDELDSLTRNSFASVKNDVDDYFVKYYGLKNRDELMPWNYQNRFFQEAPKIYEVDLDQYYKDKNLETLASDYYAGIGLPINDMLKNSDLYEKPGKNQHAFCTDIDNEGDVRVLCNVKPNQYWMNTMLHEFGHAVYDKNIDVNLPFTLRDPAHTFTTEAIAMMFGRFSTNPQWLKDVAGISEEEKMKIADNCFKTLRLEQLVFSRWAQVMYRFEKEMYKNPDQDLNKLWWDLVEKYQMLKRPEGRNEPDWATKIHIATYPCYYHNYLLGELLASQLYYYITGNILKTGDDRFQSFAGHPEVGAFLKEKIFAPGSRWYWNEMIEKATGEKLTAKYYAKQFVN
ncbi:MAG TPA: M2 family metallopeptidase [Bacteroidales bacterium]|nr:M2 family metallopeptidase [Bacteroidales bacterium]HPS62452.1 M2 family metallopeptidase [Bacteroidales bacterium]